MSSINDTQLLVEPEMPQFAALGRVLLIDASFKARQERLKDLKASALFEEIVEAKSLSDGKLQLEGRHFDACVLGTTVTPDKAEEFIRHVKPSATTQDCAFILMFAQTSPVPPQQIRDVFHGTIRAEIPKSEFTAETMRAILRANKNTPWPGIRLDKNGDIMLCRDGEWTVWVGGRSKPEAEPTHSVVGELTDACASVLADHSKSQVRGIIEKLLSRSAQEPAPEDDFTRHFNAAVREWLVEIQFESAQVATKNLRARLLSYKPRKSDTQ